MNNSNKYGSLRNTFIGADLYNLVIPVTPPADLSLAANLFAPVYLHFRSGGGANAETEVIGFNPRDKPYIRGLAFFSNMADGLVDSCSAHVFTGNSWRIRYSLQRFGARLTGTISNNVGTPTLVGGAGTLFQQECAVGQTLVWLDDNGCVRSGVILTITSDTSITLTTAQLFTAGSMLTANTSTLNKCYTLVGVDGAAGSSLDIPFIVMNNLEPFSFFLGDVSVVTPVLGRITTVTGSATLTGVGTTFLTSAPVGTILGWTDDAGVRRTGCVSAVASDISLTLTAVAYSGATNVALLDLDNHLRIKAEIFDIFEAYTVSIDPAFAGKRFALHAVAEIEHTFAMSATVP